MLQSKIDLSKDTNLKNSMPSTNFGFDSPPVCSASANKKALTI